MTWVKLDDKFHENDKQLRLSDAAVRIWVCSMSYCADQPNPTGFMTEAQAQAFVRKFGKKPSVIQELVRINAWEKVPEGYLVHDFEIYLPKSSKERVRRWREGKRNGSPPEDPHPNGTPGNAGVTRYASSPQRGETPDITPGDAPVTTSHVRARGGIPFQEPVSQTESPPTSDSLSPSPLPDEVRERAAELEGVCSGVLSRHLRGDERPLILGWANLQRDGEYVDLAEIIALVKWLVEQPTKNGTLPGTLRYIDAQVLVLARSPQTPWQQPQSAAALLDSIAAAMEQSPSSGLRLVEGR